MTLDNRIQELVAIGAAVGANCLPCLEYHAGKAQESGADRQEVAEAIEIGKMVRKGAAVNMDRFISRLGEAVPAALPVQEGCGCGS